MVGRINTKLGTVNANALLRVADQRCYQGLYSAHRPCVCVCVCVCMPCAVITTSEQIMNWNDDCDSNGPSIKHKCMKRVMACGLFMWLWDVGLIVVWLYLHTYVQSCEFPMGLPVYRQIHIWTDNVWMVLIGYSKWHLHQQLLGAEKCQKSQLVCSLGTSLHDSSTGCCIKCIWCTHHFEFRFRKPQISQ